jgi:hypothetical protein
VREACHSGRGSTKGNNETRPQSPGAAALQRTQSAHSAPTLISDQDPTVSSYSYCAKVLDNAYATSPIWQAARNMQLNAVWGLGHCPQSRWLAGWGLVRCRFASTSGIPSPSFTNRRLHTYWELWIASWNSNVRIPMSRMHLAVYIQPSGLHPLRRACPRDVKFHDSCWGLPQTQTAAQPSGSRQGPIS